MFQRQKCPEIQCREEDIRTHILLRHFTPQEVQYMCKLCQARKLSYGAAKTHKKFKYPAEGGSIKEMFAGSHNREKLSLMPDYYCSKEGYSANTSEKRKSSQVLNTAEDGTRCQGPQKIRKIDIHSVLDSDMTFHPDDVVELSVVGQETDFVSPIEKIDKSVSLVQQDLGKTDAQPKGQVTELRVKLADMEKKLRMERERCAVLERSRNRKVAELFTKEQQMKGKHVSPLLTLDVINVAHRGIPLKQGGQSQQAPKEVTQGILTKEKENTRIKHRIQRTKDYKRQ